MTEAERNWMEPDYVADDDTFYIRAGKIVVIFERGSPGSSIVRQRSFENAVDAGNFLIKKRETMIARRNGTPIPWSRRVRSGRGLY